MLSFGFIRGLAHEAGFSLCGISRVRSMSEHRDKFAEWFGNGYCAGLGYMERNLDKRLDPAALMPGAKTVVVCAVNYKNPAFGQPSASGCPKIASYAYMPDYHTEIKNMLSGMLGRIRELYPDTEGRCFCDSAPVLEKAWAVEAGLGWIGKNSLLVTPGYGSLVLLGELIINAEADEYDLPFDGEKCSGCTACMDRCPASAIRAPKVIDTGRCISRLTVEKPVENTGPGSGLLNGWVFGCDECQDCCPYNRHTPMASNPSFSPLIDPSETTPGFWAGLSRQDFVRIFGEGPMSRTGYEKIKERIDSVIAADTDNQ